jgi:hypothetical protein
MLGSNTFRHCKLAFLKVLCCPDSFCKQAVCRTGTQNLAATRFLGSEAQYRDESLRVKPKPQKTSRFGRLLASFFPPFSNILESPDNFLSEIPIRFAFRRVTNSTMRVQTGSALGTRFDNNEVTRRNTQDKKRQAANERA